MSEKLNSRELSSIIVDGEPKDRRHFIDPILLQEAAQHSDDLKTGLGFLAGLGGVGLAGLGLGAGYGLASYLSQRGDAIKLEAEADKLRAEKGLGLDSARVRTGVRTGSGPAADANKP